MAKLSPCFWQNSTRLSPLASYSATNCLASARLRRRRTSTTDICSSTLPLHHERRRGNRWVALTLTLKRLAGVINRQGVYIITASIEVAEYQSFFEKTPNQYIIGPSFSGCAHISVLATELLLQELGLQTEKVAYTFEKGDREHEIAHTLNELDKRQPGYLNLRSYVFLPKRTTLLQPSDFIAGTAWSLLIDAHRALPCLDNGFSMTLLATFQHHYSADGITAAVFSGHDDKHCFVANKKLFEEMDSITTQIFRDRPHVLRKRLKASANQGKRKKEALPKLLGPAGKQRLGGS